MSGFLRLVYLSKATRTFDRGEMSQLLDTCQTNNALLGITGVLCAGRGYFLQTLEGFEDAVIERYARILCDPRHCDASLLDIALIDTPMFSDWKMGFIDGGELPANTFDHMLEMRAISQRRTRAAQLMQDFLERLRAS